MSTNVSSGTGSRPAAGIADGVGIGVRVAVGAGIGVGMMGGRRTGEVVGGGVAIQSVAAWPPTKEAGK
jgi:hypothetical protein